MNYSLVKSEHCAVHPISSTILTTPFHHLPPNWKVHFIFSFKIRYRPPKHHSRRGAPTSPAFLKGQVQDGLPRLLQNCVIFGGGALDWQISLNPIFVYLLHIYVKIHKYSETLGCTLHPPK